MAEPADLPDSAWEQRLAAAQRVADAWNDAGPVPPLHGYMKLEVSRRWPTLAKAVEELAGLYERPAPD